MSLTPSQQIAEFVKYQNQTFLAIFGSIIGVFAGVGILGRFDKTLNANLMDYFSAKPSATDEECEGQPLRPLFKYRKTLVQIMDWAAYASVSGFIITDGLFADAEQGTDCTFAEDNLVSPVGPYTCFSVSLNLDATSFTTALNCALPKSVAEGYYCFRRVNPSEINFYTTSNVIGISAALLPPFIFSVKLLAFLLVTAAKVLSFWIEDAKKQRMVRKGLIVAQWFVVFPVLMYVLLALFHDYLIGYELFTAVLFVYVQGTVHGLITLVDSELEDKDGANVELSAEKRESI